MSVQVQTLLSREVRYQIVNAETIEVGVDRDSAGGCTKLEAELMDISQGGIRLRSEVPIAVGDSLTITISFKGLKVVSNPLIVCARVYWTTPVRMGRFCVGCSIKPTIPQELLENLAAAGILERRCDGRQENLHYAARQVGV